jgi:ABC-type branched-subunit amino acid transport system substrate-binding protein
MGRSRSKAHAKAMAERRQAAAAGNPRATNRPVAPVPAVPTVPAPTLAPAPAGLPGALPAAPAAVEAAPSPGRKLSVVVTALVTMMLLGAGLYAAYTKRDTVLTMITFVIGFVGVLLTAVQTYPGITRHLQGARRQLTYAVIVIFVAAAATSTSVILQRPVIKIAVSLPFTGGDKQDAIPILRAVKQAVKQENGRIGNFDLEIVPFDDTKAEDEIKLMSSDGESVQRVTSMSAITGDARVAGIIGPFKSGTALVEVPQANANGIPLISPSATRDCLTAVKCDGKEMGETKSFFRTCVADEVRARVLADFFTSREEAKHPSAGSGAASRPAGTRAAAKKTVAAHPTTVAILTDGSVFGDGFGNAFADEWRLKHPGVVKPLLIPLTDQYDKVLKGLKPVPDLVLFAGTGPQGTSLYRTMQADPELRKATFAGPATIMNGAINGPLANNARGELYAIAPMPYDNTSKPIVDFEAVYGSINGNQSPTPYSSSAYDATRALLVAINEAVGSTRPPVAGWNWLARGQADAFRQKIVAKLHDLNRGTGVEYSGITGTFSFTDVGDVNFAGVSAARTVAIYRYDHRGEGWTHVDIE